MSVLQRIEELNQQLFHWYQRPLGQCFALTVKNQLAHALPQLPGHCLLQLGLPEQQQWLASSRIQHQYSLGGITPCIAPDVAVDYTGLPLSTESVDVLILPHIVQFYDDVVPLFKECDRVLCRGGHVIMWGFNFCSLWGIKHYTLRMLDKHQFFPWNIRLHSAFKLKRILHQQDYDIVQSRDFFYRPSMSNIKWLHRLAILDTIGPCLWSSFGGAYFMVAKKQSVPVLMRPALASDAL